MANLNRLIQSGAARSREIEHLKQTAANRAGQPSFKETLSNFWSTEVNSMQLQADESIQKMAAGENHRCAPGDEHRAGSETWHSTLMMEIRTRSSMHTRK